MIFPTFEFLTFFAFILIFNWFLKRWPLTWRLFLLFSSYFFYSVWDIRFLLILAAVSFFNFFSAQAIYKSIFRKKILLSLAVIFNLSVLIVFKYYDFFRLSTELFFEKIGLPFHPPLLQIILPLGLSFYIFRVISYNADVYLKKIKPSLSVLDFFVYVAFFPQLFSGPIMRAGDFLVQLKNGGAKRINDFYEYLTLFLVGLFKKLLISSYLVLSITNDVFAVPENHSSLMIILAVLAYSLVIYFDFSGYSDMAIGLAGLMGFRSPLNFDTPYLSLSLRDFWRRWHITLSSWIRDYVYIPLGGNRKGNIRKYLNLLIAMVLIGLWHGAAIHFIIWGGIHGIGLTINHYYQAHKDKKKTIFSNFYPVNQEALLLRARIKGVYKPFKRNVFKNFLCWLTTFSFVSFSWIFFRSESTENALNLIRSIFNSEKSIEPLKIYIILIIIIGFLFFLFEEKIVQALVNFQYKLPLIFWFMFIVLSTILLFKLSPDIIPPFIYFSF